MLSALIAKFNENVRNFTQKTAVWCNGETATYLELKELSDRLVVALTDAGVKKYDHIGVLLPNSINFVALILAAAKLGCALVPLSLSMKSDAVETAFRSTDVKHVIGNAFNLETQVPMKIEGLRLSMDHPSAGSKYFGDRVKDSAANAVPADITDSTPLFLTLTSGSTGSPKPIVLSHKNKYDRAMAAIRLYGLTSEDNVLAATPLYHSLAERLVLIPLLLGGTSILLKKFSPTVWFECVREQHVTFTIAVSSQISRIAESASEIEGLNRSSLRCLVSSSAPLEAGIKKKVLAAFQCEFHECYGTSETAIATSINLTQFPQKMESVGREAPGTEIKIIRDNKTVCAPMENGEITVRTPMLFCGYYHLPEMTAASMLDGYFCTGDYGYLDEDGFLYYSGRKKDIIISGGINVYPSDVENVLRQLNGVKECLAFSLPDRCLGEIVAAAIVMSQGEIFDKRAARFYCAKHLADYQQPRKYFLLDELPRNSIGKLSRYALTQKFIDICEG